MADSAMDASDLPRTMAELRAELPKLLREELVKALTASAIEMKAEMVKTSPRFTGRLANSHAFAVDEKTLTATIFNRDAKVALWLHEGTKHTKAPPARALERWVERKLGVPKERALAVAFLVARKIKQRGGLKGRFWMVQAFEALKPKALKRIDDAIVRALGRIQP